MSDDLHARFGAWMAGGALGEPPRDAALHASVCEDCLSLLAARDALAAIDTGRAALPPSRLGHRAAPRPIVRVARMGLATAGVVVLGAVLAFGASRLIAGRGLSVARESAPPIAGGVLGAVGAPSASAASASPRAPTTPSAKPTPSASPTAALTPSAGEPPPAAPPPPPFVSLAASASPVNPTPTPSRAPTPAPTRSPTPSPSPTASPTPSPTPVPQCSDGIDNDGDRLIDYGLDPLVNDPDCLGPTDNNETLP